MNFSRPAYAGARNGAHSTFEFDDRNDEDGSVGGIEGGNLNGQRERMADWRLTLAQRGTYGQGCGVINVTVARRRVTSFSNFRLMRHLHLFESIQITEWTSCKEQRFEICWTPPNPNPTLTWRSGDAERGIVWTMIARSSCNLQRSRRRFCHDGIWNEMALFASLAALAERISLANINIT